MQVKLISYTTPAEELRSHDVNTLEDIIAFCARVSNPSNQLNTDTSGKLLKYLVTHKHWSPFEMANVCLEIKTTRDIARQILRHRSFTFQEFSQRYADPTHLPFTIREARLQDNKNRQNSIEVENLSLHEEWARRQTRVLQEAQREYRWAIENGIAKEVARAVLPEGMTQSTMYMSGTIRSWVHYIDLRSGPETQKEHREIAIECAKVLSELIPSMFGVKEH